MESSQQQSLTRYAPGSSMELWTLTYPLMLTALSGTLMLFCDRLFLGRYDLHTMNAAAAIGTLCAVVQFGSAGLAHIAEVFVGQYNGAGKKHQLGWPAWQMVWFSILLGLAIWPLALWGDRWLVVDSFQSVGKDYYRWIMGSSFLCPMIAALASFFIGQGKVRTVTVAAFIGNGVNIALDPLFIWGLGDCIPEMGARGAAIATVIGLLAQVGLLWVFFLSPGNRKSAGTFSFGIRPHLFWNCLCLGLPQALSHGLEVVAWALLLAFLSRFEGHYMTVHTIGMNIFILCTFITEGMFRAAIAIVSNFIGAGTEELVPQFLRSGVKLTLLISCCVAIPLLFFPETVIRLFMGSQEVDPQLYHYSIQALRGVCVFFFFDLLAWLFSGVLTGSGNTKTVLFINTSSVWIFGFFPCVFWLSMLPSTPATAWLYFSPGYALSNFLFMFAFYRRGIWRGKNIDAQLS